MHACTVISRSHLAQARVLARSFLEHHPGSTFHALVLDPGPGLRPGQEPFEFLVPEELFTPEEWGPMWFAYTVPELAFATKPRLLRHLLDAFGGTATYLDCDIRFYRSMDWLQDLSERYGVVLTPHTVGPLPFDGRAPTEHQILQAGAYNLGFVSVGQAARPFLDWWWQQLERQCLIAPNRGLNGDQRWIDLAPALFDCHILKDPTLNVAYWNLGGRQLAASEDRYLVDGKPLTFFHFSGYDLRVPWLLSKYDGRAPRVMLSENPALRRLCDDYGAELLAAGHDEVSQYHLDQETLPDGVVLDERARRVYRSAVTPVNPTRRLNGVPNPITEPHELVAWLQEPADPRHPAWLSRYLYRLYRERKGLVRALPDVAGSDGPRFLAWVRRHGVSEEAIPAVLMPSTAPALLPGISAEPVGEGVNVVGFLRGEFGLGEAARQVVGAVQALGAPLATVTYSPAYLRSRQEHSFAELRPVPVLMNPFDVNIVCVNPPESRSFAARVGPDFFAGRCTVGYWAWELEEFPDSWLSSLDAVDEVWMNSKFAAIGVSKRTTKPVRVLPIPVWPPTPSSAGRSTLGLPDRFMFLFAFDSASGFERKNPDGLVRAFKQAFAPGEGPLLVVKSVGGDVHPDKRERLRYEAGDRPDILLLEDYLSPGDKNALMASCDCYVSLHRSEGFGLTMAEAMALGKPTIATGYSGNLEFMSSENSFLVGFGEGRVPPDCSPYRAGAVWAEPDLDHAAELMRRVYGDPVEARRVGERARADMALLHGPEARARLLGELLGRARSEWRRRKATESSAGPMTHRGEVGLRVRQARATIDPAKRADAGRDQLRRASTHPRPQRAAKSTGPTGLSAQPVGEGVNVIGHLRGEFGLGEAARQVVGAVQALGVPLATYTRPVPRVRQEHPFEDLQPVPGLINPFNVNIVCVNFPQARRFAADMGPAFCAGRYTVGYWAWELEEFPETWTAALDVVDEVWMNSEFAAIGVRRRTTKPVRVFPVPVRVPVPSSADRRALGLPAGFLFLFVFDYGGVLERKNPVGLVRAFKQAFAAGEGPVLVVKSVKGGIRPEKREKLRSEVGNRPDILLLEDYLSPGDKNALMASCDCYVSLHRSEGFGLTMAEAMALGKPTIATGYSGNLEFMTPENSFLVRFSRGQVPPDSGHYPAGAVWAEPDLDHAAELMRRVYRDPEAARRVGERARADIVRLHGPEARARLLGELLGRIRAEWGGRNPKAGGAGVTPQRRVGEPQPGKRGDSAGRAQEGGRRTESRPEPATEVRAADAPLARRVAPGREQDEELRRAQHDLVWLLRRLGRPPLGWILARRKGYRRLRERWLPDG